MAIYLGILFRIGKNAELLAIVAVALGLRTVFPGHYPEGLFVDEVKNLLEAGRIIGQSSHGMPTLVYTMFTNLPEQILGPWWAIRWYSAFLGSLTPLLAYAISLRLYKSRTIAITSAVAIAVLPWSILYGRVSEGANIIFHGMLVLWCILEIISKPNRWNVGYALLLAFGNTMLWYDYFAGRALLYATTLVALLPVSRRPRIVILASVLLTVAAYYPQFTAYRGSWGGIGFVPTVHEKLTPNLYPESEIVQLVLHRIKLLPKIFTEGYASHLSLSLSRAAVDPFAVLAIIGLLLQRRALYSVILLLFFAAGMAPGLIGPPQFESRLLWNVSIHRIMCALPLISITAMGAIYGLRRMHIRNFLAYLIAFGILAAGPVCFFTKMFELEHDKHAICTYECNIWDKNDPRWVPIRKRP